MKRAYLIGDNELAKMSVADEEVLEQQLLILEHVGFDLTLVGEFDSYELDEPVVVEKELDIEVKEPAYKIVINCTSAQHQDEVEADLSARGFDCHRVQV